MKICGCHPWIRASKSKGFVRFAAGYNVGCDAIRRMRSPNKVLAQANQLRVKTLRSFLLKDSCIKLLGSVTSIKCFNTAVTSSMLSE
eukprot:CAMPEP_0115354756 /NCGR_PEP_ID=MMETSP0270-20121206/98755_1 /TAXON_ID=71861 /ORGANISM="Scrippsiella trochoidea, Strain CCMP3099" /LENGTH=86 /DNA_ID=CAMNT_0002777109 /DNA_START=17 /DNA_END=274 /DNA_ORIENTATION=+